MKIADADCAYCHEHLSNWDYRYHGEHYCRKCYDNLFHLKVCNVCKKQRKIYYALETPVCKSCQVRDEPCIRCGKERYAFGKITKHGSVCNSCAKYFVEQKRCTSCKKTKLNVSNRVLADNTTKLLCGSCYSKTLPVCISCGYRKKAYTFTLDVKPLCRLCSIEKERLCTQCGKSFPAGYGRVCKDCHAVNTLAHKIDFIVASLSIHLKKIFVDFSKWLTDRRGLMFASIHLQHYYAYFFELNEICLNLNRLPSYEELAAVVTIAKTRSNLAVTLFLNEKKLIVVDKKIKEECANLDMINRYLATFEKGTYRAKLIYEYYQYLDLKLKNKQTTIRSIRLSLTPAVKLLQYCSHFNTQKPTLDILKSYLWYYPGQRASITGFINFLADEYNFSFSVKDVVYIAFQSPNSSREQLKLRLIDLLRTDNIPQNKRNYFFRTAIGFLHGINIPDNIFIDINNIKMNSNREYYIRMHGSVFYLPAILYTKMTIRL